MSAVTTTSGMAWKIPGRVRRFARSSAAVSGWTRTSAAPVPPGAAKRICGFAARIPWSRTCGTGCRPKDAILDALETRVARNFDNDLERLAQIDLHFYALRKDGEYAGGSLWDRIRAGCAGRSVCGLYGGWNRAITKIRSPY